MKESGCLSSSHHIMYQAARMEEEKRGMTSLDVFLELPYSISTYISLARTWSPAAEGELGTRMVQPSSSDMTG